MAVSWPGPGFIDFANVSFLHPHFSSPEHQPIHFPNTNITLPPELEMIIKSTHKSTTTHHPPKTTKKPHQPKPTKTHRTTTKRPHHPHPPTNKPHHTKPTKPHHPHTTTHKGTHHTTHQPTKTTRHTTHRPTKTTRHSPKHTTPSHPHHNGSAGTTTPGPPKSDVYTLDMTWDDATWILLNSIIIFMMQMGFGLLEGGIVAEKNVVNIMMKNIVDVVLGGITYWACGFSLSYGADPGSNGFAGVGEYAVDSGYDILGPVMVQYFFQLSFATTSTTIVSGTMAERCNFKAYCIFSFVNTIVYSVPCKWIWGYDGWLGNLGCIDIAGSGAVHLLGGVSGYVSAWMLGPRIGRYENGSNPPPLQNPSRCIWGLFILWWGWLAFNCGSTFGVTGDLWKFAARTSATTMVASFGGGLTGSVYTLSKFGKYKFDVMNIINTILGALVGVTAGCALYHTFDALIVGIIGGIVVLVTAGFADWTRVDDPVGATAVHGFCGIWGMVAVGLFAEDDQGAGFSKGNAGVFRGGTLYLICIQMLACVSIIAWAAVTTFILLFAINLVVPLRMKPYEELLGADFSEHLVRKRFIGITPAVSVFASNPEVQEIVRESVVVAYTNPTHDRILEVFNELNGQKRWNKFGGVEKKRRKFSSQRKTKPEEVNPEAMKVELEHTAEIVKSAEMAKSVTSLEAGEEDKIDETEGETKRFKFKCCC